MNTRTKPAHCWQATLLPGLLLCAALASAGASAQPLGRLFMTPAERAALEQLRRSTPVGAAAQSGARTDARAGAGRADAAAPRRVAAAAPAEAPASGAGEVPAPVAAALQGKKVIVVNGMVRRSGGGAVMTWVDAVPYPGPARLQGGAVVGTGQGGQVTVVLRSGQRVTLKPGQEVDTADGQVREAYQPRPTRPPPRTPAPGRQ